MGKFIPVSFLLFLSVLMSRAQETNLQWALPFGSPVDWERGLCVTADASGNVYAAGNINGTCDFDPGPDTLLLTVPGNVSMFISKQNPDGSIRWVRHVTRRYTGGYIEPASICTDRVGNIYVAGLFTSAFNFNAPSRIDTLAASNWSNDGFIAKLDSSGNFVWIKALGNNYFDWTYSIRVDEEGNIYDSGIFQGEVDFDPGPGTFIMTAPHDNHHAYVRKLDSDGNFLWAKSFGRAYCESMTLDDQNNVYLAGYYSYPLTIGPFSLPGQTPLAVSSYVTKLDSDGNFLWAKSIPSSSPKAINWDGHHSLYLTGSFYEADFDPGPDTFSLTSLGNTDIFILKLDTAGQFAWAGQMGGPGPDVGVSLSTDTMGNVFFTGYFEQTADLNPGIGSNPFSSRGGKDIFICKMSSQGDLMWVKSEGGPGYDEPYSIYQKGNFLYLSGTFFGTVDFDPEAGTHELTSAGGTDLFIQKLGQDLCHNVALSIDSVSDVHCGTNGYAAVHLENGTAPFVFNWNSTPPVQDSVVHFTEPGNYEITITDALSCQRSTVLHIDAPRTQTGFDLDIHLVNGSVIAGFPLDVWLHAQNNGCPPTDAQLKLVLDSRVLYLGADIPPDEIVGDTLIWNLENHRYGIPFVSKLNLKTTLNARLGEEVCFWTEISPFQGDTDSSNNRKIYCPTVVGSYDPNDKQVYPKGACDAGYIVRNERLTYTVRFQNTGTAPAVNVHIIDSLNPNLDLNTLHILANSHPMFTKVLPDNTVDFVFSDIQLPDSSTNEPESHGYVIFEISPTASIPDGTVLENGVGIYFDFNEPVITNTVRNTVTDEIPVYENTLIENRCDYFTFLGHTYTSDTVQQFRLHTVDGCDSTVTLMLSIRNSDSTSYSATACGNYTFNGHTYNATGAYTQYFSNLAGCDSILTLQLTVNHPSALSITETACGSYTLNGQTYDSSGTYTQHFTNISGCDSILTLQLTVNRPSALSITETACGSYTLNGQTYDSSGTYTQTLSNITGCDSTITLLLTVHHTEADVFKNGSILTAGNADSYRWFDCGNYMLLPDETAQIFHATVNGSYGVIISQNGCVDSSACYTVTEMGIAEYTSDPSVTVYPNPADQRVTIRRDEPFTGVTFRCLDISGKVVRATPPVYGLLYIMDISDLAPGMYLLQIFEPGKKISHVKIMIE